MPQEQGDIINRIAETTVMLADADIPTLGTILRDLDQLNQDNLSEEIERVRQAAESLVLGETGDMQAGLDELNRTVEELQMAFGNPHYASMDERQAKRKRLEQENKTNASGSEISALPLNDEEEAASSSANRDASEEMQENYEALLNSIREDETVYREFIDEAVLNLEEVEHHILSLEASPEDATLIDAIFRPFHTIKGVAGFLNLIEINKLSHLYEDLLDGVRRHKVIVSRPLVDLILEGVDTLRRLISELSMALEHKVTPDFTVNVELFRRKIQEAQDNKPTAHNEHKDSAVSRKGKADTEKGSINGGKESEFIRDSFVRVDIRKLDQLIDMIGELVIVENVLTDNRMISNNSDEKLQRNVTQLKRITGQLRDLSTSLRMVPVKDIFHKMQRVVRDLGRKSGKNISLEINGETTEIDRSIADELYEPLVHIIRNNCDHGIEPSDERISRGKARSGTIVLNAYHRAGRVVIEVSDDGRGIDFNAIRKKAVDREIIKPDEQVTQQKLLDIIFNPDFSTSKTVTEISGRGVGLDVVKRTVNRLNGNVDVQTKKGEGTTFTINLPLTLAMIDGVIVGAGQERYIVPSVNVRETFRPNKSQHRYIAGKGEFLLIRDEILPLIRLGQIFDIEGAAYEIEDTLGVVIEARNSKAVLLIDRLIDKKELVIKSLGEKLSSVSGLAGGAILADGQIGLIIDVGTLMPRISI